MSNGQSVGSEQQVQQIQSRSDDQQQQLVMSYQNMSQNGSSLFPGANGNTMLSKTADKRQSYGQRHP